MSNIITGDNCNKAELFCVIIASLSRGMKKTFHGSYIQSSEGVAFYFTNFKQFHRERKRGLTHILAIT